MRTDRHLIAYGGRSSGKTLGASVMLSIHGMALAAAHPHHIRGHDVDCIIIDDDDHDDRMLLHTLAPLSIDTILAPKLIPPDSPSTDHIVRRLLAPDAIDALYSIAAQLPLPRKPPRDWAAWLNQRFGLGPHIP